MSIDRSTRLTPFAARWLAEAVRGGSSSADGQAEAEQYARSTADDFEQRVFQWARFLGERDGTLDSLLAWRRRLRLATVVLVGLALLGGFSTALAVLGDSRTAVNVIWVLGALLGLHLLTLVLWLINIAVAGPEAGGMIGRLWFRVVEKLGGRFHVPQAFATVSARAGVMQWWLSMLTHAFWLAALCGAWLGLVAALSLRAYSFGWETTILPPDLFVRFVELAGWLPAQAGFAGPDAEAVRRSALEAMGGSVLEQEPALRRAWSSWLLGALLFYGIVLRGLVLLFCAVVIRHRLSRFRIKPSAPAWAGLGRRLNPISEQGGVTGPASVDPYQPVRGRTTEASGPPAILALELGPQRPWPPPVAAGVRTMAVADSREQRYQALIELRALSPRRLLLVCDAELSPDRGTLGWLAELSALAAETRVRLLDTDRGERLQAWREALGAMGFTDAEIILDEDRAQAWLEEVSDHG